MYCNSRLGANGHYTTRNIPPSDLAYAGEQNANDIVNSLNGLINSKGPSAGINQHFIESARLLQQQQQQEVSLVDF